ncbi:MAG: gliding motility protein [Chitinophagales bacterium]|nr:MAG: gliding motility protein [Chitinophagales bacterium]
MQLLALKISNDKYLNVTKNVRLSIWAVSLPLCFLLFSGCSSSKKTGKTSLTGKVYHDITARNNAYFNGKEKLKIIQKNIAASHKDNYDDILDLQTDRDVKTGKNFSNELDEVVKKASFAIKRHEPSKWTDNSYLLVGKSYFLKGDFDAAIEAFQFITTEFKDNTRLEEKKSEPQKKKKKKSGKKKKKKKKKSSSAKKKNTHVTISEKKTDAAPPKLEFLKLFPRAEAMLWMADAYTEQKKFKQAEQVITLIEAEKNFPRKHKRALEITKARLFIKKGSLERAIPPLTQAIQDTRKKRNKARYYFVLGQIYERLHDGPNAVANYEKVLKNRPPFDMAFNAQINIARIAAADQSMPAEEITKMLNKLLKDSKNEDFFDQVYYALAELALSRGNTTQAVDFLKKSVQASTVNNRQKARSMLRLADLYYAEENYLEAQPYYDSTLALIDKKHERYYDIENRAHILKELIEQLQIVSAQDSLLEIASLPEAERKKVIEEIIQKKQQKKDPENTTPSVQQNPKTDKPQNGASASASGFYFYNVNARTSGYNNFIKTWGNRKLEDNWRRSNKNTVDFITEDIAETAADAPLTSLAEAGTYAEDILKALPLTEAQVQQAQQRIEDALYKIATIYRIDLKNNTKAISAFQQLAERFPETNYLPEVYYNLYTLHEENGYAEKANQYKNLLLSKFPDSRYARYIQNPSFLKEENQKDQKLEQFYTQVYMLYEQDSLDQALAAIGQADSLFPANSLKPKFDLLKAYIYGKKKEVHTFLASLQDLIDTYPNDPVRYQAEEILSHLKAGTDSAVTMQINISEYKYDPDAIHFFMVILSGDSVNSSTLSNAIAGYNDINRSLDDLKINAIALNDKQTLLVVKSFKNMKAALDYYNAILSSELFKSFPASDRQFAVVSDVNFNKIIMHREAESYQKFFKSRYNTNP